MNIELHGFPKNFASETKIIIWNKLIANLPYEEAVNSVVTSRSYDTRNCYGKNTPFLRVYSEKISDFTFVETHLKSICIPRTVIRIPIDQILLRSSFDF
jgi:hypothetical protein